MHSRSRILLLLISFFIVTATIGANWTDAQYISQPQTAFKPIPQPSIPVFNLSYINHPDYDYREVHIEIRNQPFNYTVDGPKLFYNYRVKNHFSNNWTVGFGQVRFINEDGSRSPEQTYYPEASTGEKTTLFASLHGPTNIIQTSTMPSLGSQVDFQVKAYIGYLRQPSNQDSNPYTFSGKESAWSDTQTLNFDANTTPTSSNPTLPPNQSATPSTSLNWTNIIAAPLNLVILIIALSLVILISFLILYIRRKQSYAKPPKLITSPNK
jgi:hypothetical protein